MILKLNAPTTIKPNLHLCFQKENGSFEVSPFSYQVLSNGRVLGVVSEYILDHCFENITNIDPKTNEIVKQGDKPDLFEVNTSKTISVKSISKDGGWITQSGLFDMKRGESSLKKKKSIKFYSENEWDEKHNSYMKKYDFILLVDTYSGKKTGEFLIVMIDYNTLKFYGKKLMTHEFPYKLTRSEFELMCKDLAKRKNDAKF